MVWFNFSLNNVDSLTVKKYAVKTRRRTARRRRTKSFPVRTGFRTDRRGKTNRFSLRTGRWGRTTINSPCSCSSCFLFLIDVEHTDPFIYAAMGSGGWEGNFLITASSKDKTFCHLLYSLQKQKPSVKIIKNIKTCCQNIKTIKTTCQNHQKHQNLLSFIIQPSKTKTFCQNHQKHQNLLSKHQNHQNLLSRHQNHQNHLSKSSKPTVNNIKTIKTTCQKHQNLLSL